MLKVMLKRSFLGSTGISAVERDESGTISGAPDRASVNLHGREDADRAVPSSGRARPSGPPPERGPLGDGSVADSGDGHSEAGSSVRLQPSPGDREPACGRPSVSGPRRLARFLLSMLK